MKLKTYLFKAFTTSKKHLFKPTTKSQNINYKYINCKYKRFLKTSWLVSVY